MPKPKKKVNRGYKVKVTGQGRPRYFLTKRSAANYAGISVHSFYKLRLKQKVFGQSFKGDYYIQQIQIEK